MTEVPEFSIAKLQLEPGDVLVLRFKQRMARETIDNFRQMLKPLLPDGVRAMILEGDVDIVVLTAAEIEQRATAAAA